MSQRGSERVSENTIAYFAQKARYKASFFVFFIRKREKFAQNVGGKGENENVNI